MSLFSGHDLEALHNFNHIFKGVKKNKKITHEQNNFLRNT